MLNALIWALEYSSTSQCNLPCIYKLFLETLPLFILQFSLINWWHLSVINSVITKGTFSSFCLKYMSLLPPLHTYYPTDHLSGLSGLIHSFLVDWKELCSPTLPSFSINHYDSCERWGWLCWTHLAIYPSCPTVDTTSGLFHLPQCRAHWQKADGSKGGNSDSDSSLDRTNFAPALCLETDNFNALRNRGPPGCDCDFSSCYLW